MVKREDTSRKWLWPPQLANWLLVVSESKQSAFVPFAISSPAELINISLTSNSKFRLVDERRRRREGWRRRRRREGGRKRRWGGGDGGIKRNPPNTHVGPVSPASLRFSACECGYASVSSLCLGRLDGWRDRWMDGGIEEWRGATLCGHFSQTALRASEPGCNSLLSSYTLSWHGSE